MRTPRAAVATVLLFAAPLVAIGCTTTYKATEPSNTTIQLEKQMRGLPSLEATEQHVTATLHKVADAASAIEPTLQWREHRERSSGTCKGAYAKTGGISVHTRSLLSDTPIPDARWQQILGEVRRIAAENGIDQIETRAGQAGNHNVRLYNDSWSEIRIASSKNAVMVADTGCRFTEKDLSPPN